VKEGDRNTVYFQAVANQRRRKKPSMPLRALMASLRTLLVCSSMLESFIKIFLGLSLDLVFRLERISERMRRNYWMKRDLF